MFSTKGVGATTPDFSNAELLEDGLLVPLGEPKKQPGQEVLHLIFTYKY